MSDDQRKLNEAKLIWKSKLFQDECKLAREEMYAQCLDAIRMRDYPKADSLNAACEALMTFFLRFEQMAKRNDQLTEPVEEDQDEDI